MDNQTGRTNCRFFRFGKKVGEELFDIFYEALSKDPPAFGEVPRQYNKLIKTVLQADLIVQAGRGKDLPEMSNLEKEAVIAYQKAQNKVQSDIVKKQKADRGNNQ